MSYATLTGVTAILYLLASTAYFAHMFVQAPAAPKRPGGVNLLDRVDMVARLLLAAGVVTHFCAIGLWCVTTRHSPFAGAYGTLSVGAWAVALTILVVDLRLRLPAVGALSTLFACVLLTWAESRAAGPIARTPILNDERVSLHVMAILASFALFALAFGCACLYLIESRLLKRRRVGMLKRLPPLETLDSVAYHSVAIALPLLTIGLALGMVRVFGAGLSKPPSAWLLDVHTLISIVIWLIYGAYLGARLVAGWRGVRLQYVLIVGLALALAVYFVPTNTHQFS